jgi:hypothetical protein
VTCAVNDSVRSAILPNTDAVTPERGHTFVKYAINDSAKVAILPNTDEVTLEINLMFVMYAISHIGVEILL